MMRLATFLAALAAFITVAAVLTGVAVAYPAENDSFAAATVLEGPNGWVGGANFKATKEPGEPAHAGNSGGASLWYRWVAPHDGTMSFIAWEWGFDPVLAVYTGTTLGDLVEVASNDDWDGFTSRVVFDVVAGTELWIAVDGYDGATGSFGLQWFVNPENDDFADAALLEGARGDVFGSNIGATVEPGEPLVAGGTASVWYSWTAPVTGHVRFNTHGSEFDTVLGVYTGTAVDALTCLCSNDDFGWYSSEVSFLAEAGTTYAIAVGGWDGETGSLELHWYPGAILQGTGAGDVLRGTPGADLILGLGGGDTLYGNGGADEIVGGAGRDRLYGGPGPDFLDSRDGRRGNDAVYGGRGHDTARADRGDAIRGVP